MLWQQKNVNLRAKSHRKRFHKRFWGTARSSGGSGLWNRTARVSPSGSAAESVNDAPSETKTSCFECFLTNKSNRRFEGRTTSSLFRCSCPSSVLARLSWLCRSKALDCDALSLAKTLWMLSSTCRWRRQWLRGVRWPCRSFDSTVSDLSLSIIQSLLQLSRQDAALSSLLLQLLLKDADTSFLRSESLGHLSVFYVYVLQLPTINAQSCWKLRAIIFSLFNPCSWSFSQACFSTEAIKHLLMCLKSSVQVKVHPSWKSPTSYRSKLFVFSIRRLFSSCSSRFLCWSVSSWAPCCSTCGEAQIMSNVYIIGTRDFILNYYFYYQECPHKLFFSINFSTPLEQSLHLHEFWRLCRDQRFK